MNNPLIVSQKNEQFDVQIQIQYTSQYKVPTVLIELIKEKYNRKVHRVLRVVSEGPPFHVPVLSYQIVITIRVDLSILRAYNLYPVTPAPVSKRIQPQPPRIRTEIY
jgi:hypothetical protein